MRCGGGGGESFMEMQIPGWIWSVGLFPDGCKKEPSLCQIPSPPWMAALLRCVESGTHVLDCMAYSVFPDIAQAGRTPFSSLGKQGNSLL